MNRYFDLNCDNLSEKYIQINVRKNQMKGTYELRMKP